MTTYLFSLTPVFPYAFLCLSVCVFTSEVVLPLFSGGGVRRLVRYVFPHPVHPLLHHGVRTQASLCDVCVRACAGKQAGRQAGCGVGVPDLNIWISTDFRGAALTSI